MDDTSERPDDGLDNNWVDKAVAATRGAVGLVPMLGGPLAEIISVTIPGQRADRIVNYVRQLSARLDEIDADIRDRLVFNAEKIGLIEEGGYQAARATSNERIERIVAAVQCGLAERDVDVIRRKRLLTLLGELDDDELNLLYACGRSYGGRDRSAFELVNRPDPINMQSGRDEIERNHLYNIGRAHLIRLGLLKKNYGSVKKGQLPEFDPRSGDFKHSVEVSGLGLMLLSAVELGVDLEVDLD